LYVPTRKCSLATSTESRKAASYIE
jgi:hypothetical protein